MGMYMYGSIGGTLGPKECDGYSISHVESIHSGNSGGGCGSDGGISEDTRYII